MNIFTQHYLECIRIENEKRRLRKKMRHDKDLQQELLSTKEQQHRTQMSAYKKTQAQNINSHRIIEGKLDEIHQSISTIRDGESIQDVKSVSDGAWNIQLSMFSNLLTESVNFPRRSKEASIILSYLGNVGDFSYCHNLLNNLIGSPKLLRLTKEYMKIVSQYDPSIKEYSVDYLESSKYYVLVFLLIIYELPTLDLVGDDANLSEVSILLDFLSGLPIKTHYQSLAKRLAFNGEFSLKTLPPIFQLQDIQLILLRLKEFTDVPNGDAQMILSKVLIDNPEVGVKVRTETPNVDLSLDESLAVKLLLEEL